MPKEPDICSIAQAHECIKAGAHVPLEMPGEAANIPIVHTMTGIPFAKTMFCKRCGLLYWEPQEPQGSIVFTEG